MRLFTAVDIPSDIRAALAAMLDRLRPLAQLHWIPAEKLHITTKFIGEWPEERLDELTTCLARVTSTAPVDIAIRRIGWLPNPRSARTLYAGVEASEALVHLAKTTEQAAESIGIAKEDRMYRPHVTLARTRKTVPLDTLRRALAEIELAAIGSYTAWTFALYVSASGTYTKLQEFRLNP